MSLEKEDFTLDFESGKGTSPNSSSSKFTCHLGETIRLDSAWQWEVCLKSISIPRDFDTVHNSWGRPVFQCKWKDKNGRLLGVSRDKTLPAFCSVKSPKELIDEIYKIHEGMTTQPIQPIQGIGRAIDRLNLSDVLVFTFNESSRTFFMNIVKDNVYGVHSLRLKVKLCEDRNCLGWLEIANIFGVKRRKYARRNFTMNCALSEDGNPFVHEVSERPSAFLKSMSLLDVRCNIAGRSPHTNTSRSLGLFPLVAWLQSSSSELPVIFHEIVHPIYVPVVMNEISSLSFALIKHGDKEILETLPNSSAPTKITLELRKVTSSPSAIRSTPNRDM